MTNEEERIRSGDKLLEKMGQQKPVDSSTQEENPGELLKLIEKKKLGAPVTEAAPNIPIINQDIDARRDKEIEAYENRPDQIRKTRIRSTLRKLGLKRLTRFFE